MSQRTTGLLMILLGIAAVIAAVLLNTPEIAEQGDDEGGVLGLLAIGGFALGFVGALAALFGRD